MRTTIFSALLLVVGLLASCGEASQDTTELKAVGGKKYGGNFKFMSAEKISNFFPTYTGDHYSARLVQQIYEPLLTIDPQSLAVVSNLAESYEVSEDAQEYTFHIRKGVYFHDDDCFGGKGRELNARDVKYTLDYACSGVPENQIYYLLVNRIKGAKEYFDATKKGTQIKEGVSGIKVVDDNTIKITLKEPFVGFEKILTHSSLGIFPPEVFDAYGDKVNEHPIGTGPFKLASKSDSKIILVRNPKYWQKDEFGNKLPFMDSISISYSDNKKSELQAFQKGAVDLVLEIPAEEVDNIFGTLEEAKENIRHKVDSEKSFSLNYMAMDVMNSEFKDVNVRKAFNMAINREDIIESWLEGEGWPATHGFVPAMKNYPIEKVNGFKYDPETAKSLMKTAGYPDGKGFPIIDVYVNTKEGSTIHKMSQAIAAQIKTNLNVDLNIVLCTYKEREEAIKSGKAKMWRTGWIADYPDPENFLAMFYGGNIAEGSLMMNVFKYQNPQFDKLFEQSLTEKDPEKRMNLLVQCDQIIVDDAAVIPVFTDDHIVIVNARVRGFDANPMESLVLKDVFIKEFRKDQ